MAWLFYGLWSVLSFISIFQLLINKREPSSTLSWLFFVITLPILGSVLFLIFGPQRIERIAIQRKERLYARFRGYEITSQSSLANHTLPDFDNVLKLAKQISEYEFTDGNAVSLLNDPVIALREMEDAIARAKHFIHLEYYIIASDEVTEQLFDGLIAAAKRGVQIRVLYDALGSLSLKRIYFRRLTENGIKIAGFLPFSILPQRINFNFRNHRKILIVDGNVAFTGGTNIGKEYLGRRRTPTQWRDYSVKVEGPVCLQLQDVFAKDWHFTTNEDLFTTFYYPEPARAGDSSIQVLESGPDTAFRTLHQAMFLAINSAEKRIFVTTPYFVPDSAMMTALTVAALRGVEVKILLPSKSDSRLVQYASRSFYDTLLRAGAQIYEYQPRILHAKMMIIDDKWTILGSANMDIRSFRLNFELNLLVYGEQMTDQAEVLFNADLAQSSAIDLKEFLVRPLGQQMLENACRLLSPVL